MDTRRDFGAHKTKLTDRSLQERLGKPRVISINPGRQVQEKLWRKTGIPAEVDCSFPRATQIRQINAWSLSEFTIMSRMNHMWI